jgi:hypothetical protein
MSLNAIDERESDLLKRLREIEASIDALRRRLVDPNDTHVIDTDVGAAGGSVVKGSQRLTLLQDERKAILMELASIPYDQSIPIAIGTDAIGTDAGEAVIS